MKTSNSRAKRRDLQQCDSRETNVKMHPLQLTYLTINSTFSTEYSRNWHENAFILALALAQDWFFF